mmetsp:Transcript_22139/g.52607  ORF Transcript_22139/g.52607 Transcript_22139/m.52607 type:complete len:135 (+) Transcript_22139:49-453(+)
MGISLSQKSAHSCRSAHFFDLRLPSQVRLMLGGRGIDLSDCNGFGKAIDKQQAAGPDVSKANSKLKNPPPRRFALGKKASGKASGKPRHKAAVSSGKTAFIGGTSANFAAGKRRVETLVARSAAFQKKKKKKKN